MFWTVEKGMSGHNLLDEQPVEFGAVEKASRQIGHLPRPFGEFEAEHLGSARDSRGGNVWTRMSLGTPQDCRCYEWWSKWDVF